MNRTQKGHDQPGNIIRSKQNDLEVHLIISLTHKKKAFTRWPYLFQAGLKESGNQINDDCADANTRSPESEHLI